MTIEDVPNYLLISLFYSGGLFNDNISTYAQLNFSSKFLAESVKAFLLTGNFNHIAFENQKQATVMNS